MAPWKIDPPKNRVSCNSSISSESQFIGAFRIVLPISLLGGLLHAYVWRFQSSAPAVSQSASVSWSFHDIVAASSDVDRSLLQLALSGTRVRTLFRGNNAEHNALYKSTITTTTTPSTLELFIAVGKFSCYYKVHLVNFYFRFWGSYLTWPIFIVKIITPANVSCFHFVIFVTIIFFKS